MKKAFLFILITIIALPFVESQVINGTYAIQNTSTGKNLRPYEAGSQNGNKIVLYDHVEWKCMTWKFTNLTGNTYQLQNLYTSKTFQAKELPARSGIALEQQPLSKSASQEWEFIKEAENTYYIRRLKGSDLFITAPSENTNSDIILKEKQTGSRQLWKLVAQNPGM